MQPSVGATQAVKAQVGEVQVRPTLMVRTAAPTVSARTLAQDTAQTAADPAVQGHVYSPLAMSKESKPSLQRRIQRPDDPRQAVPVGTACLRSDGVFQLVQALRPRQSKITSERVAQEGEALRPRVHDLCLGRMQRQAIVLDP